jgi:hypothetical protein
MRFQNNEGQIIKVEFADRTTYSPTPVTTTYNELTGRDGAFKITTNNDEEVKDNQVVAQKARITVASSVAAQLSTFADGEDNRYLVTAEVEGTSNHLFTGHLVMTDHNMPFLPVVTKIPVQLTATDNLGLLKELPLTNFSGATPKGEFKKIEFLAWALSKTGLELPIVIANNYREQSSYVKTITSFAALLGGLFPNSFTISPASASFFYVGQKIKISNTASNNGIYTVTGVGSLLLFSVVSVAETIVDELDVEAHILDYHWHWAKDTYLHIKTFESEIGACEDCYTVIKKILAPFNGFITQYGGQWFIGNYDEYEGTPIKAVEFDHLGAYVGKLPDISYDITIDKTALIKFRDKDQMLSKERPFKYVEKEFRFEYPQEILDNIDFSRGGPYPSLTVEPTPYMVSYANFSSFPATGEDEKVYKDNATNKYYKWRGNSYYEIFGDEIPTATASLIEDWFYQINGATTVPKAYIKRIFEFGYERERFAELTFDPTVGNNQYLHSNPIPVSVKDKFSFGVDFRLGNNYPLSNPNPAPGSERFTRVAQLQLTGDSGTVYVWDESKGRWIVAAAGQGGLFARWTQFQDQRDWQSVSAITTGIPETGLFRVVLEHSGYTSQTVANYQNIQFEYIPYINGSYKRYKSISFKANQSGEYRANLSDQIHVADSLRKLFKGSILIKQGTKFYLTKRWYDGWRFDVPPTDDELKPLAVHHVRSLWNQHRSGFVVVSGSVLNLNSGVNAGIPSVLHAYTLSQNSAYTQNKLMLVSGVEIDYDSCKWSGTFMEYFDTVSGKDYTDPIDIKFTE